ncbi:tail fiber assembly protein [Pseudomonas sp. PS02290]|uniref:tail fiber assembly protein n=1 Tax=Pseudomonas sp. PS02290 TaxID=2991430 RepID=UPI00249A0693|nr:tail fiber assembly protein [Pseudomonas sp. PS02290]
MANYAVLNVATRIVENLIIWDGSEESGWSPSEGSIAIAYSDENPAGIGYSYLEGKFVPPAQPEPPAPTPAEILERNTGMRDSLLARATLAIAPLQDAVDLDDATTAEVALLKKWKQYRVAVNRFDLTTENLSWPDQPQ